MKATADQSPEFSAPQRTAVFSMIAAAFLVALKLVTGLITGSLALIAEAAHSGTDLVAAILTFFAVRVAGRPADREHPYGHGKAEHLAALAEGAFLVILSLAVVYASVRRLAGSSSHEVDTAWWAFVVLGVVLLVDVSRAVISWRASKRYDSAALAANALHFASDFAGSLAVLVGLVLVSLGVGSADSVAALLVAGLVIAAAASLMRESVGVLMDRSSEETQEIARAAIERAEPTVDLRRLRVRETGGRAFVDAVLAVSPDAAVGQGHAVADNVERALEEALPRSDVTIHIEQGESRDLRERATGAALSVRRVREVHNVRSVVVDGGRIEMSLHAKLPADQTLADAHAIADEIERAVRSAIPQVGRVHVHLEPLDGAGTATAPSSDEIARYEAAIAQAVRDVTGRPPREVGLHLEARGLVAYVSVEVDGSSTLAEAHEVAKHVEARAEAALPVFSEVVVHTEPA
ncbi:unannotated protein [freshwater metagenome]|uniref:Unannotated protein n=1 Tax=freshwater metagenome TaxID=449393 RepID=A0A6J7IPA4_9ZZZZ